MTAATATITAAATVISRQQKKCLKVWETTWLQVNTKDQRECNDSELRSWSLIKDTGR